MKKTVFFLFLVSLIVPVAALDAVVVSVVGKAEMQTAKGWESIQAGTKIGTGTMISTGFKSQAVLEIGKSTVTVQPLSRLTVEQLTERADADVSKIYLDAGSLKANVKAAENKRVGFTVKSPVATASVRGTSGTIDAFGSLVSTSGIWAFAPPEEDDENFLGIAVSKGSGASVTAKGSVVPPQIHNTQTATSPVSTAVAPSTAEVSGGDLVSPSSEAQNAAGQPAESGRVQIPLSIGWAD
ncbi:FecR domain-containing protein [Treponema sp. OMZ 840]|uniref:FecR domain-containing protein n=1 Tax=Treponema sp. OMZ 840 TaxID=244313 RepID=UPI003D8D6D4B